MSGNTTRLRPGVVSEYTVTPLYARGKSAKAAAVIAQAVSHKGMLYCPKDINEATMEYSAVGDKKLLSAVRQLFMAGVSKLYCFAADGTAVSFAAGLEAMANISDIGVLICESDTQADLTAAKNAVVTASGEKKERIALVGTASTATAKVLAKALDCERMVLCCGSGSFEGEEASPMSLAVALAGEILCAPNADINLNSAVMRGLTAMNPQLSDTETEELLAAGAVPFEQVGGAVECVRCVTTSTTSGGVPDSTYRDISTVLIIDEILMNVRNMLKLRLKNLRNNAQTRESIATQIAVLLSEKTAQGVLESFAVPQVSADTADASICVVELAFTVAHVVNRIHIKAQITV